VSELADEHDLGSYADKVWVFESFLPHSASVLQANAYIIKATDVIRCVYLPC